MTRDWIYAHEAVDFVLKLPGVRRVLDIGFGDGCHTRIFESHGKEVSSVDSNEEYLPTFVGEFAETDVGKNYDLVWASHVLEHAPNAGLFLRKCFEVVRPYGYVAITVPRAKPEIVGGHLSMWTAGLLLYNMIMAGFDCRHAAVKTYTYNISVVVRKQEFEMPELTHDWGDIARLAEFFPFRVQHGFDGRLPNMNWSVEEVCQ
jgi:2-polyprenyl-3-methyl-5-hydroxy-6-metoxy-1,4-benzoquinol methylase